MMSNFLKELILIKHQENVKNYIYLRICSHHYWAVSLLHAHITCLVQEHVSERGGELGNWNMVR